MHATPPLFELIAGASLVLAVGFLALAAWHGRHLKHHHHRQREEG